MKTLPVFCDIVSEMDDATLPEKWRTEMLMEFSHHKILYEYQQDAIKNAAKALYLYYGDTDAIAAECKKQLLKRYCDKQFSSQQFDIKQYERATQRRKNPVFDIYALYIDTDGNTIPFINFINRMGFWMATGSGKTPVIVKLISHIWRLKQRRLVPSCNVLILAPTEHALRQIQNTVREFNAAGGMRLEMKHLREFRGGEGELRFNNTAEIYYCRTDHLSEDKKEQMLDWRDYENNGRWFVFLDEAHKGEQGDSKRKAYYSLLARNGFLFNFSATFADAEDIYTTVARYNLADFVGDGRGKRILRATSSFGDALENGITEAISKERKKKIVLESLLALAAARACVCDLRKTTGYADLYHMPLMLTLVNSVNTDENKNDLLLFFEILRLIAGDELNAGMFDKAKKSLLNDWRDGKWLFANKSDKPSEQYAALKKMTVASMREHVFGSRERGALEYMEDGASKQIAFKLKTADAPFGMIKIGDIKKWTNEFLREMESVPAQDGGWFERLDDLPNFSLLMGSRAFFESWDSNRPNVICFINIGVGKNATIFITQSVGRGVRIELLRGRRQRLAQYLAEPDNGKKNVLEKIKGKTAPPETLVLYATNERAVDTVLEGMRDEEEKPPFTPLGKVFPCNKPSWSLLIPEYDEITTTSQPFYASRDTQSRLQQYAAAVSDSVLMVAHGMTPAAIADLRAVATGGCAIRTGDYDIDAMQNMFRSRGEIVEKAKGVRDINNDDIVHFLQMEAQLPDNEIEVLKKKINAIAGPDGDWDALVAALQNHEISQDIFKEKMKRMEDAKEYVSDDISLFIRRCAKHYYAPLITADKKAGFIRYAVDEKSEVEFLESLGQYLKSEKPNWDKWMFCKLHPHRDCVYIPYYDNNRPAKFFPDFVFWMRRGDDYRIVFVDPKSTKYTSGEHKIDGYAAVFEEDGEPRVFSKGKLRVRVGLLFFNQNDDLPSNKYAKYWTSDAGAVFAE